jgi:hypothetical protein
MPLGHELGHVFHGHTRGGLIAASGDEREQREREADTFAKTYAVWA